MKGAGPLSASGGCEVGALNLYFGITSQQLRQASAVGGVLGALLLAIFLPVAIAHGTVRSPGEALALIGFVSLIGAALPGFISLGAVLGIRVVAGHVEQLLLGTWSVSRRPLIELRPSLWAGMRCGSA